MPTIKTVGDLITQLSHLPADTPIFVASQPTYPMRHTVTGAVLATDGTLYLAVSEPTDYLPHTGRTALDW